MNEGTVRGTFDLNVPARAKLRTTRREAERLEGVLDRLGQKTVRPSIELTGITRAREEVALLRAELNSLDRMRANPFVSGAGGRGGGGGTFAGAAAGSAFGGGGRRGGNIRTLDFGPLSLSPKAWPVLAGAGLPAINSLVGATGALAGTITGAGMVGGATALAGGGALATGIGTIVSVAKPATKAITDAYKAQTDYNEAIRQFGRGSTQAVTAKYEMDRAFQKAPQGTRRLIQDARTFSREWRRATSEARRNIVGFYREGIAMGTRATPALGPAATRTTGALRRETRAFGEGIFGRPGTDVQSSIGGRFVDQSSRMFDENLTQARRFAVFGTTAMMQLTIAARPFLLDATRFMANWSKGWASSTSNITKTRRDLRGMVPYVRSIRELFGAGGRLAFHTVMQGAPAGRSMLDRLTDQLNVWDRWVQRNPSQVRAFFRRTVDSTVDLARALFRVARELGKIGDTLLPVLQRFSQLTAIAGDLGLLQPGALAVGIGAFRGMKGGARAARGGITAAEAAGAGAVAGRVGARGVLRGGFGGALRGAGRAAWPVALGFGALDAASFRGNVPERFQAALSGASLGLIPMPVTNAQIDARRMDAVRSFSDRQPANRRGIAHLQERQSRIRALMARPDVSPEMTKIVNEQLRDELRVVQGHLRDRLRAWRSFADQRAATLGARRADRHQQAFGVRARKLGPERALDATGANVLGEMRGMRREGARILGQNTLAWAAEARRQNPALADEYRALRRKIVGHFRAMGDDVALFNGRILIGSQRIWKNVGRALSDPVEKARQEITASFTAIQKQAIGALRAMGFSPGEARTLVRDIEGGGARGRFARANIRERGGGPPVINPSTGIPNVRQGRRATGGRLVGGHGLSDSIHIGGGIKAANQELILNRHTERDVDRDLRSAGRPTLDQRVRHETRRHAIPAAGSRFQQALYGARTVGGFHPELQPGIRAVTQALLQRFPGLLVTSTTGGGHAANSYHYRGMAADIGGSSALMNAASAWIRRRYGRSLAEGIHNPNLSIKGGRQVPPSFWGASTWAGHANHIHLAVAGALAAGGFRGGGRFPGMGAQQIGKLGIPGSRLGGVPGAMSQRAQQMYAGGLRKAINRRLGSGAFGVGGGPFAGMRGTLSKQQIARLWVQAGGPPGMANLMAAIALAESGGRTRIVNSIGATGLWQIHPGGQQYLNPRTNASTAVMKYRTQGLGAWEAYTNGAYRRFLATGGRTKGAGFGGWFGGGGAGFARRPTMIGIGDRLGGEDFAVLPRRPRRRGAHGGSGRAGRGRGVQHLHVHFDGDVSVRDDSDIDKVAEKVAGKLIDALDDGAGDEGLDR